jgi:hypothetical protein
MTRRAICCNMCFELGPKRIFWRSYGHLKKTPVWSVCMVTVIGARFATIKLLFGRKPTPLIIFWASKMSLLCSARVRRLIGILRRAHVTIIIVAYGNFRSQLSGISWIFEDFDWAPVIFTEDVQRKTYGILLWKYFPPKKKKKVTVVVPRVEFCVQPP